MMPISPNQTGPPEIELDGWLRHLGHGTIRLGQKIGLLPATFWILRVAGQPFGNQHRVCIIHDDEAEILMEKLRANGGQPVPVTLRGILFSMVPGREVHLVATRGGVICHPSADALARTIELRRTITDYVSHELRRLQAIRRIDEQGPTSESL